MINFKTEIAPHSRVGITGHVRPDGDCVGAVMSLYHYLNNAIEDLTVDVYLEEPSYIFDGIKDIEKIKHEARGDEAYDVFIICDTNADRIGFALPLFQKAGKTINIDHHISNASGCAMLNHVEPETGSCCEVLAGLYDRAYMDEEIAREIYIGIIHDTGVLQYSNTTPKTHMLVAELIGYGFDFTRLIDETFYEKSFRQNKLLGHALLDARLSYEDRVISAYVPFSLLESMGATPKTTDGIVNQLRITRGVHVALFMYGLSETEIKASLRSDEFVDVSVIAECFGGGGHKRASGFNAVGISADEVLNLVLKEVEKQLK